MKRALRASKNDGQTTTAIEKSILRLPQNVKNNEKKQNASATSSVTLSVALSGAL
jgi:hypothetical protein